MISAIIERLITVVLNTLSPIQHLFIMNSRKNKIKSNQIKSSTLTFRQIPLNLA